MLLKFGVQGGGGKSREKIQPFHIQLNKIFKQTEADYFNTIGSFGIYYRVNGPIRNYGNEGPDKLEYLKKQKELGIDFVVSEESWSTKSEEELKIYFTNSVQQCFYTLLKAAEDKGFIKDSEGLVSEFEKKLSIFQNG